MTDGRSGNTGGSEETMSYPLGGSKTFKFRIDKQKNKGLKL